jgi:heme exporter protein A
MRSRRCSARVDEEPPAIELRGLERHFGERTALRQVTVTVPTGATLAVLGRNGAGKSTLLRILATLLSPHAGEVSVLGEPVPRRGFAVRGRIGYLGHEPLLYRDLTGRENLHYHARLHGLALTRVDELLEMVGMRSRADDPVRTLSRGMVQRLAVCRATFHNPPVLLLDEPRANLDPGAGDLLEPLIGRAAQATRVITSHDPAAVLTESDLVLGLHDGRRMFVSQPDQVEAGQLEALYR